MRVEISSVATMILYDGGQVSLRSSEQTLKITPCWHYNVQRQPTARTTRFHHNQNANNESTMSSNSDSDSDSSTERRKKKKRSSKKKDYDSDDSSNNDDSGGSSDDEPTLADTSKALEHKATGMAEALATEFNQLRHTVHHLMRYLTEERGVTLPTIYLLGEQSAEKLLSAAKQANPTKTMAWIKWLDSWREENFNKTKSRYQLLLQLKADLRCFSRGLESKQNQKVQLPKEWLEAMLYGKNYELLMKDKKDKLDEARFRKQRLRQQRDLEHAEWEKRASEMSSVIQRMWRSRAAFRKIQAMLDQVWEKVYDPDKEGYYYYNRKTDTATWDKPKLLKHELEGTL
jgi:hypothetical protein